MRSKLFTLAMLVMGSAASFHANAFSVCTENEAFPPLTNAGRTPLGHSDILIEDAAKNLGVALNIKAAPWKRCQNEVENGDVDAILATSYAGKNIQISVFPMVSAGVPDSTKGIGSTKTYLYRRVGSKADFVNGKFVNLTSPVGILPGYQAVNEAVTKGGAQVDEGAKTVDQQAQKMINSRLDMVAADIAFVKLVDEKYKDQLEPIPSLLMEASYYLSFSSKYYNAHKADVEKFWTEMAKVKASPAYKAKIK